MANGTVALWCLPVGLLPHQRVPTPSQSWYGWTPSQTQQPFVIAVHRFDAGTGSVSAALATLTVPAQPMNQIRAAVRGEAICLVAGVSCWIRMPTDSLVEVIDGPPLPDDAFPQPPTFCGGRRTAKRDLVLGLTFAACQRVFVLTSSSYRTAAKIFMWKMGAGWQGIKSACNVYRSTTIVSCGPHLYKRGGATAHMDSSDIARAGQSVVVLRVKRVSVGTSTITFPSSRRHITIEADLGSPSRPERLSVPVSKVFYSQDSVSSRFGQCTTHAGQPLEALVDDLLNGKVQLQDVRLVLDVIDCGGRLISLSNRRLYCVKTYSNRIQEDMHVQVDVWKLHEHAILPEGRATTEVFCRKFTTPNCGVSVQKRNDASLHRASSTASARSFSATSRSASRKPFGRASFTPRSETPRPRSDARER